MGKAFELSAEDSQPTAAYYPSSDDDMIDAAEDPPSDAGQFESGFPRVPMDVDSPSPSSRVVSGHSMVSKADSQGASSSHLAEHGSQVLADVYKRHSTASDVRMLVTPPASSGGFGRGVLVIPGWIRERAAEVLFEGGDVDEVSVAEVILESLLKVGSSYCKPIISSLSRLAPPRFQWTSEGQWLLQFWLLGVLR